MNTPALHLITRSSPPRIFRGYCFGLKQPALATTLSLALPNDLDTKQLATLFRQLCLEANGINFSAMASPPGLLRSLAGLACALQRSANIPVFEQAITRQLQKPDDEQADRWRLIMPYWQSSSAVASLDWTIAVTNSFAAETDYDHLARQLEKLRRQLPRYALGGTNAMHFAEAAFDLGTPFMSVERGALAIGHGTNSRVFNSTITDATPSIGVALAANKIATAQFLKRHCLPTTDHILVNTPEKAIVAAESLGFPVVIKPPNQEQGRGVSAGLKTQAQVQKAYAVARKFSKTVMVERHLNGDDYRLTIINSKLIKVMRRRPLTLIGDGSSSITQLATAFAATPNQRDKANRSGKPFIVLNEEALDLLSEQGHMPESVPERGREIICRRKSNISEGGSHELIPLESIHPTNKELAIDTARLFGLDFAGVDLITTDITLPWHSLNARIVEVNAQPQLGYRGTENLYKDILMDILDNHGKIENYFIYADSLADTAAIATLQKLAFKLGCNAISTKQGVWIDGAQVGGPPESSLHSAQAVLSNKRTQSALICMTRAEVNQHGFPAPNLHIIKAETSRA